MNRKHSLANEKYIEPQQLSAEILITYPVTLERLDINNQFLLPAGISPKRYKPIETTDIILQMVGSGRGVTALPRWLVEEYASKFDVVPVPLGEQGIHKHIFLGIGEADINIDYVRAFLALAHQFHDFTG